MKRNIKILIYIAANVFGIILCLWYFGLFGCTTRAQFFNVVSDVFFVLGGIEFGISLISFCVAKGMFDSLSFKRMHEDSEKDRKRPWLKILGACGAVMLFIGIVFGLIN